MAGVQVGRVRADPKSGKGNKGKRVLSAPQSTMQLPDSSMDKSSRALKEWPTWALKKLKTVAHYGFIPLIIVIGMTADPKPHWTQLLTPV